MANSDLSEMEARLTRLETNVSEMKGAVVHITHILLDHGERLDTLTQRVDTLTQRVDVFQDAVTQRLDAVTQRLDRLIEVTVRSHTATAERFADVDPTKG